MNKVIIFGFGLNFFVFGIITLIITLYLTRKVRNEGFFDSTGALVQLASTEAFDNSGALTQLDSTRVVSQQEEDIDEHLYDNLTRQGIINMTESGYKGSDYASAGKLY
jgi:hypothetical protein